MKSIRFTSIALFGSCAVLAVACSQNTGTSDGGDARPSDARADVRDVGVADRGVADVPSTGDGGDVISTSDVPGDDSSTGTDATTGDDVPTVDMDATSGTDVPTTGSDVPSGTDVPATSDTGGPTDDVPASCGPAPTLTVTSPPPGTTIETCSVSDMPIYYDFTVQATGSITDVQVNWVIDGSPFAAPVNLTGGSTFTVRKQVGGMPTASGEQPLTRASNALTGSWQFTAIGTDACGRTVMTSRPFSLEYTRLSRCPNP